jgi:hypothetical protein
MRRAVKGPRISAEQRRMLGGQSTASLWALTLDQAAELATAHASTLKREEIVKLARFQYAALVELRRRTPNYDARQGRLF